MVFRKALQTAFLAASFVAALPAAQKMKDDDLLNYALSLEHLEDAFYTEALQKFSEHDFLNAGFDKDVFGRIKQVAAHEKAHVKLLETALGDKAVKPCVYNFPISNLNDFVSLALIYENVGTAAYSGAVPWIDDLNTALVGETILSTEANHGSFIGSAVAKANPWSGNLGTPLSPPAVLSLASPFIVSCPASNPPLPFTPLPVLKATPEHDNPLKLNLDFAVPDQYKDTPLYFVLIQGFSSKAVPISNHQAILPDTVLNDGTLFGFVSTKPDYPSLYLKEIVAGPTILVFPYGADVDDVKYGFPN